jgi:hypothetical protein
MKVYLLLLVLVFVGAEEYNLDTSHSINLITDEEIILTHEEDEHKGIWAVGRYPNDELEFLEGRIGAINGKEQRFTVKCKKCKKGEEIWVDFWLVNSETPELWFEDKQGYIHTHKDAPLAKLLRFKVDSREEL